jgi:hypothetical protein
MGDSLNPPRATRLQFNLSVHPGTYPRFAKLIESKDAARSGTICRIVEDYLKATEMEIPTLLEVLQLMNQAMAGGLPPAYEIKAVSNHVGIPDDVIENLVNLVDS